MAWDVRLICRLLLPCSLSCFLWLSERPLFTAACAQSNNSVRATAHAGGIGRFAGNHWGVVKGTVFNDSDTEGTARLVVMVPGGDGIQFARRLKVPPNMYYETTWPVWIPPGISGRADFQYLLIPGSDEEGVIRRREHEEVLASFTGIAQPPSGAGFTALVPSMKSDDRDVEVQYLLKSMRFAAYREQSLVAALPGEIGSYAEALDPVSQLAVTCDHLGDFPDACESIRLWLQRGGRMILFLDHTGPAGADLLLGEVLPLTVVGKVSTNEVTLTLNPEYRVDSYPVREVFREYDEPVHYLRIVADAGEPIWFVDGWPVALRVPFGSGVVIVTTISPQVFFVPKFRKDENDAAHEVIPSMRRIHDSLFLPRSTPLLDQQAITQQAAAQIGYQIPSRFFAGVLAAGFPLILLAGGLMLLKRNAGEQMVWLLPLLAILVAAPAVGRGMMVRAVAPSTVIQTQIVQSLPGQTALVSDGYVTTYNPAPTLLSMEARDGAVLEPGSDVSNLDYRRMLWTGRGQNEWINIHQPAGISTYSARNIRYFSAPIEAVATFDATGLTGQLSAADLSGFRGGILAGKIPDLMSVRIETDGKFRVPASDVLAAGQYFRTALMDDEQRQYSSVYSALFGASGRSDPFPEQPSLLYWADASRSPIRIGDEQTRQYESLLIVQPIRLQAPEAGTPFVIPPALLPFRIQADEEGSFSTLFSNAQRRWNPTGRDTAGKVRLQFDLPEVCLPFEAQQIRVHLKIRAGSRDVVIRAGTADNLQPVHTVRSPVGAFDFTVPPESLQKSTLDGHVLLQVDVSDLTSGIQKESDLGVQDDSWVIESLYLMLQGTRVPAAAEVISP